jgi:4-hydroxy-3-polyprenylbenzoate decarboxylase
MKQEKHLTPKHHLRSLREYIEALREIGECIEVEREVDWNLEIGAITRRVYELGAPAPLFNKIKGIAPGFRVLGAPAGISSAPGRYLSRVALSLGLPATASGRAIIEALVEGRDAAGIAPRIVSSAPCKENIDLGDAVNLLKFPTPFLHEGDGGRYIGTYGTIVARTPDGTWTNWSNARVMLLDEKRMTGIVSPFQHLGMIHKMWKEQGKDMPFALCLGVDPAISFVSGMPLPKFVNESDYLGGYLGEALDVIACETVKLEVPATSEIVIEGYLSVTETTMEGPMGEYAGYLWAGAGEIRPVYHVTAVTYRHDPILPIVVAGEPVEEDHTVQGIPSAAETLVQLREAGIPATMAWVTLEAANHWLVVTLPNTWKQQTGLKREELFQKIGNTIFQSKFGAVIPKVIVLNDDIDASDTNEVVWGFATRVRPVSGEHFFNHEATSPLVAFLTTNEKFTFDTTKVVYDGLAPDEWGERLPLRTSFKHNYSQQLQQQVLENWEAYGYKA